MPPASVVLPIVELLEPSEPPLESSVVVVLAPPAALAVVPLAASLVVLALVPPLAALRPPAWLAFDSVPSELQAARKSVNQRLPVAIFDGDMVR